MGHPSGSQEGKLEVHDSKDNGDSTSTTEHSREEAMWVLSPGGRKEGGLGRCLVSTQLFFVLNCVTLDSPPATPSLSFLSGCLGAPSAHRSLAQSDIIQQRSLHPTPPPPHLRASIAGGHGQELLQSTSPFKQTNQKKAQPKCLFGPLPDFLETLPDFFQAWL